MIHNMGKSLLVSLLYLFLMAHGFGEPHQLDYIRMATELENMEIEEPDDLENFCMTSFTSESCCKVLVNVDAFGAKGDGVTDDTQAFREAWNKACGVENSVFLVPQGRAYLVSATRFSGPCAQKLIIQIDGKIVAPDEPLNWDKRNTRIWLFFSNLMGVIVQGKGVIDGSGSKWWSASCKKNKSNPCVGAPSALTIASSSAVRVSGIKIQNSQQMHFVIAKSESIRVSGLHIMAPGDSPNTDGVHITESKNVVVEKTVIGTGDDCVSIVSGSSNIKMKDIVCGPGHGISIGSLGKDNSTGMVANVVLSRAVIKETTNGLRIKTWQGGNGYVHGVMYQNVKMESVENPIIIDQFYCDSPVSCKTQTSAVKISGIMYKNIWGTTVTKQAIKFDCSDSIPCTSLYLSNVCLQNEFGVVETYCHSATGIAHDYMQPSADCLNSSNDSILITKQGQNGEDSLVDSRRTEL